MKKMQGFRIYYYRSSLGKSSIVEIIACEILTLYRHMFFTVEGREDEIRMNVDQFSDSFARDTDADELKEVYFTSISR